MQAVKEVETAQEDHKALLALLRTDPNDGDAIFNASLKVAGSFGYVIGDILDHASHESGPRRKEWHKIVKALKTLADDAACAARNKNMPSGSLGSMGVGLGEEYARILSDIRDLGGSRALARCLYSFEPTHEPLHPKPLICRR
jgi:hypothetical protein